MARFSLFRKDKGSAIVEFALVVPIFFLLVSAVMMFGRAYQRLNVLTGGLREGGRYASTLPGDPCSISNETDIRNRVGNYATAFGVSLNTALVIVDCSNMPARVRVWVNAYPLFSDLVFFGLDSRTVTRAAIFRHELAP